MSNAGFFFYTVEYFSDVDDTIKTEKGFVYSDSFAEAAQCVEESFGEVLESIKLEGLEPGTTLSFDEIRMFMGVSENER